MKFKIKSRTPQWMQCQQGKHLPVKIKTISGGAILRDELLTYWLVACRHCGETLDYIPSGSTKL